MGYPNFNIYIYSISLVLFFNKNASTGGLVSQIQRWSSSTCTSQNSICGPCLQLDFFHAQTSSQAYGRLANMRLESSECGVGRNKHAEIHTTKACKSVLLSHEERDGWNQDQSNCTGLIKSHATDLRSGASDLLQPELISLSTKIAHM